MNKRRKYSFFFLKRFNNYRIQFSYFKIDRNRICSRSFTNLWQLQCALKFQHVPVTILVGRYTDWLIFNNFNYQPSCLSVISVAFPQKRWIRTYTLILYKISLGAIELRYNQIYRYKTSTFRFIQKERHRFNSPLTNYYFDA